MTKRSLSYQYTGMEKQQFFGYWRWIHVRVCSSCKNTVRILGGDTRQPPNLPPSAIRCPKCENQIPLG